MPGATFGPSMLALPSTAQRFSPMPIMLASQLCDAQTWEVA